MVGVAHGFFCHSFSRYQPSNSENTITLSTEAARTDARAREGEQRKKLSGLTISHLHFTFHTL